MKTKEIVSVVASSLVIVGSLYFAFGMIKPGDSKQATDKVTPADKIRQEYSGNIKKYKDTLDEVKTFDDYGEPALGDLGRDNPFAPLSGN